MGNDSNKAVALGQAGQGVVGFVEGFWVKGAEALVHEERIQADARGHLHLVRKAQRQCQRGQEGFAAGERIDAALRGVDMVNDIQLQTGLTFITIHCIPALQVVLPAGHFLQTDIGPHQDLIKISPLNIGFQLDFLLPADVAVGGIGQGLHPGILLLQIRKGGCLGGDMVPRPRIGGNAIAYVTLCIAEFSLP